ncbi:MAG: amino acid synthesis family protein, partial [Mesorhizobium sp.]
MPAVVVRKFLVQVEEIFHEGGPLAARPPKRGAIVAVIANPFAGRYVEEITGFMEDLKPPGLCQSAPCSSSPAAPTTA